MVSYQKSEVCMRKKSGCVAVLASLAIVLASCQSTVTVKHLMPATVNMGSYRTIAVASTDLSASTLSFYPTWSISFDDFGYHFSSGYERNSATRAAVIATDSFTKTMQESGFFTVLPPSETDKYLALGDDGLALLKQKGVKAIVTSSISYLDLDEEPYSEDIVEYRTNPTTKTTSKCVVGRKYYISQKVTVSFTYLVRDIESGTILASDTFTGKRSRETEVARRVFKGNSFVDEKLYSFAYAPSVTDMISSILDGFQEKIARKLMPSWQYSSVALMDNKPKNANVKDAYRLADSGKIEEAYSVFVAEWENSGHVPSGYNAALMLEAMGNLSDAVTLMHQVANESGDGKAYTALSRMLSAQKEQEEAQNQIQGTSPDGESGVTTTQIITGN